MNESKTIKDVVCSIESKILFQRCCGRGRKIFNNL